MKNTLKYNKLVISFFFLLAITGNVFSTFLKAQSEAVKYPALNSQMNQWDCDDPKRPSETFCRVKQMPEGDKISNRLTDNAGAWSENELLTISYRAKADSVEAIVGGTVFPMSQVSGTDFWAVVLKAPRLESGIISYRFIIVNGSEMKVEPPDSRFVWRGATAPPPPAQSKTLQGKITREVLQSINLSEPRNLTVYSPPLKKGEKPSAVIYIADGQMVTILAPYTEALIASKKIQPILLVGVHSAGRLPDPDPRVGDLRAIEYLIGGGKTPERFEKHERFFINEVVRWAELKYGAPKAKVKRGIFGVSNGGAFAIAMGTRHFNMFGHVFGFSNSSKPNLLSPEWSGKQTAPSYYLLAGLWEFRVRNLSAYAEVLRKHGAKVTYVEPIAEHDATMWHEQFTQALLIHFGKNKASFN